MKFSIQIWNEDDAEFSKDEILEAASIAHGQAKATQKWFDWKYLQSPLGKSLIAYAKEEDSRRIAGVLIFGMYRHYIDGVTHTSALSYETFVMPEYRGQKLFLKLINVCIDELRARGVHFIFNFPNTASLPGFIKTGWLHKDMVEYFIKPNISPRLMLHFVDIKKPFVEEHSHTLPNLQSYLTYYHNTEGKGKIIPQRDSDYLKWRYNGESQNHYIVVETDSGMGIFRRGKRGKLVELQLLDFTLKNGDYNALFSALFKKIRKTHSFDIIGICLSKDHDATSVIRKRCIKVPTQTNFTYYVLDEKLSPVLESYKWMFTANEFHTY